MAESKPSSALGDKNNPPGEITYRITRDPSHYSFKIESFSKLLERKIEKYESGPFYAGDYKWRLIVHPNGDKQREVEDGYISLYIIFDLDSEEAKALSHGWKIVADMKLFAFDWIKKSYRVIHGMEVSISETNPDWGFERLLSHQEFTKKPMGYLDKDCCIFGAEIIIMHVSPQHETLSIVENPRQPTIHFKIQNFKKFSEIDYGFSPPVIVAGRRWKIAVHPNGDGPDAKENWLSAYIVLCDADTLLPKGKVYVEYKLRVRDQRWDNHVEFTGKQWFTASDPIWGCNRLLSRGDLHQDNKGFVFQDTLIIEAEIIVVSEVRRSL